ncbi:hypothetical protein DPMN_192329 [Dreissena polymorpha]|uniref:Uncharacterized protein n=1 Tax=Dreissena polymorpha TaxID=45954 RepID=A0A9D3Y4V0_DREPO|nr:hypothetical protein DPMN_192329 [Dreissena polymorpha]
MDIGQIPMPLRGRERHSDTAPDSSRHGYINDSGRLNLERFEKYLADLSKIDYDTFCERIKERCNQDTSIARQTTNQLSTPESPADEADEDVY